MKTLSVILCILLLSALFNGFMSWLNYPGQDFYLAELGFAVLPLAALAFLWLHSKRFQVPMPAWLQDRLKNTATGHPQKMERPGQGCSMSSLSDTATYSLLPWLCNPFVAVSIGFAAILFLGAEDTRLASGTSVTQAAASLRANQFPLVLPDPTHPDGPPLHVDAAKLDEFLTQHPGARMDIPPTEQGVLRSGNRFVVYSSQRENDALVVRVATHPDQPGTTRLGHFYTQRSLYRIKDNRIEPLAAKRDIPLVKFAPLTLMVFLLWVLPSFLLTRTLALRHLRTGPPFDASWLLVWGAWMRFANSPTSWAPILAALRDVGAEVQTPSPASRRLARLGSSAKLNVRFLPQGGFIVFIEAGQAQWAAPLAASLGPVALILAVDHVLASLIDPLLPGFAPTTLALLFLTGIGALSGAWRLLHRKAPAAEANRLATILHDAAVKQGCRKTDVTEWSDLQVK